MTKVNGKEIIYSKHIMTESESELIINNDSFGLPAKILINKNLEANSQVQIYIEDGYSFVVSILFLDNRGVHLYDTVFTIDEYEFSLSISLKRLSEKTITIFLQITKRLLSDE